MPEKSVRVKVVGNYRVLHDGKAYVGGDQAIVPERVAAEWQRNGWAEPAGKK